MITPINSIQPPIPWLRKPVPVRRQHLITQNLQMKETPKNLEEKENIAPDGVNIQSRFKQRELIFKKKRPLRFKSPKKSSPALQSKTKVSSPSPRKIKYVSLFDRYVQLKKNNNLRETNLTNSGNDHNTDLLVERDIIGLPAFYHSQEAASIIMNLFGTVIPVELSKKEKLKDKQSQMELEQKITKFLQVASKHLYPCDLRNLICPEFLSHIFNRFLEYDEKLKGSISSNEIAKVHTLLEFVIYYEKAMFQDSVKAWNDEMELKLKKKKKGKTDTEFEIYEDPEFEVDLVKDDDKKKRKHGDAEIVELGSLVEQQMAIFSPKAGKSIKKRPNRR